MAQNLAKFLEFTGGRKHAMKLFKALEMLLVLDEVQVRNEALKTFKIILEEVDVPELETELIELLTRLGAGEYISHKQSAINLVPILIGGITQKNKSIIVK